MKKAIKITLLVFISIILLFIASLFTFGTFYGDKISGIVISELNKRLNVKVAVGSIEFSMFKHFPSASISLNDVIIYSSETFKKKEFNENTAVFLTAKHLSLQFNVFDLLKKKYDINKIAIINSKVSIFIDKKGDNNFKILKDDTSSTPSKLTIDLKKVQAENCEYVYIDNKSTFVWKGFLESCLVKGKFSSNDYNLETSIKGKSRQLSVNKQHFPSDIAIELESSFHVIDSSYTINKCKLTLNDIETKVSGKIQKKKFYYINLNTEVEFAKLSDIQIYLPVKIQNKIAKWKPEAELKLTVLSKGSISNNELPSLSVKFDVENGNFTLKNHQNKLNCKGIFLSKDLNDINSYSLKLDTFDFFHGSSEYTGKLSITDFNNFHLKSSGYLHLNIEDIYDFVENDKTILKGLATGKIAFETDANTLDTVDEHLFEKLNLNSNLEISSGYFKYKPNAFSEISDLSASIKSSNDVYEIDTCKFQYYGSQMSVTGKISNILKYILSNNQVLNGDLIVKSNCIDYNKIIKTVSSDSSAIILPLLYNVKVTIDAECLNYQKMVFQNIRGQLTYNADGIKAENISLLVFGGRLTGDVYLSQLRNKSFELKSKFMTTNIYVDKVFTAMNNFNQKTLVDKNIKGLITSQVQFSAECNNDFSLKPKTLVMQCDATIMNGKLLNFEPMKKLSKFVDVAELENISFSTLKNSFVIKDEKITIPQMEIKSSALSLQMSGTHNFSNNFEYNVQLYLSELLAKKHHNKHPDEYFGEVVDDGAGQTRLPIKIIGTPSGITMSYDTKTAKENVKESLKKEKSEIARIFKEEFGLTKKDTSSVKRTPIKKEDPKPKFEIEFE
jgi:hypothetical protein